MSDAGSGSDTRGGRPEVLAMEIETAHGSLRAMLAVPQRPLRLPELALNFMGISNKLTDLAVDQEAKEGRTVSCRKGCGACCRQLVPLSPPEAWMIADVVAGMPPARQAEIRESFAAAAQTLETSGIKAALAERLDSAEQMVTIAVDYFRLQVACPFLRDESCSIHPYRPSICREYMVTSPAESCAQLGGPSIARIPVQVRLSEALANLTARLLDREAEVIPLPLALSWADAHREEGERTWDARLLIEGLIAELSPGGASPAGGAA
jgi:Fe-S-cluster containining protein